MVDDSKVAIITLGVSDLQRTKTSLCQPIVTDEFATQLARAGQDVRKTDVTSSINHAAAGGRFR